MPATKTYSRPFVNNEYALKALAFYEAKGYTEKARVEGRYLFVTVPSDWVHPIGWTLVKEK